MTFLQPYILWGLPLLLIPVIIHLINRLRHRPQPWAAMRFLRTATQSSISQAKLRQFLVLLFRVLAVLALLFFLSRPLAGGWLGWALSPAPEVIVLVLDRSASMEARVGGSARTAREQAIDMWREALGQFEKGSRLVLVDSGSPQAQELPNAAALGEAGFTGATDASASIPDLLQRALNYLVETKSGAAEIWIASDLQAASWNPEDGLWGKVVSQFSALPQKVRFRLLTFEEANRKNVSVTLIDALKKSRQAELEVTLDLQQDIETSEEVVLRANINGVESESRVQMLGQTLRWRNVFPIASGTNAGWGSFSLAADANEADNIVFYSYEGAQRVSSLVVSSDRRAAFPLQLAASDLSQEPVAPARLVAPEEFAGTPLTNVGLVAWSGPLPQGIAADLLRQFVESGGALIFFPGEEASAGTAFAGLGWGNTATAESNQVFQVAKWNELDGPLAKTEEGFGVPVAQLEVWRRASISGGGTTLASFEDGSPFLVRKAEGQGEIYFCATSPDADWSSLAEGPVLVPMLQRLLLEGSRRVNSPLMLAVDETGLRDVSGWIPLEGGGLINDPRLHAGLYRSGGRVVAVNRAMEENELQRLSADRARELFGQLPFQLHRETSGGSEGLQGEVWRMFLVLMLVFLIVEGLLVMPPAKPADEAPERLSSTPKARQEVAA